MWKKDEVTPMGTSGSDLEERPLRPEPRKPATQPSERATIGPSITIVGEVKGDEDLLIQGKVDGSVDLKDQSVTIGREGRVKANITGRVVAVEGEVEGDLKADDQVILRSSARVQGDISAPRVVLEDGASFRGMVDMGDPAKAEKSARGGSAFPAKREPEPVKTPDVDADKTSPGSTQVVVGAEKEVPVAAGKSAS